MRELKLPGKNVEINSNVFSVSPKLSRLPELMAKFPDSG